MVENSAKWRGLSSNTPTPPPASRHSLKSRPINEWTCYSGIKRQSHRGVVVCIWKPSRFVTQQFAAVQNCWLAPEKDSMKERKSRELQTTNCRLWVFYRSTRKYVTEKGPENAKSLLSEGPLPYGKIQWALLCQEGATEWRKGHWCIECKATFNYSWEKSTSPWLVYHFTGNSLWLLCNYLLDNVKFTPHLLSVHSFP